VARLGGTGRCVGLPGSIEEGRGQPEVENLRARRRQLDVCRFEIAMNDAALMRGVKRVCDLGRDLQRVAELDAAPREAFLERGAVDELEDERRPRNGFFEAVNRADPRMVERGEDVRLAAKPADPVGIARHDLRQDFEGNIPAEFRVARAIHLAQPTSTRRGDDFVRAEPGSVCQRHRAGFAAHSSGR
jgi:hypothetical protein